MFMHTFWDFGQLPPVMDLPLYITLSRGELSNIGSTVYHSFDKAVILDKVMCQSGEHQDQILLRNILLCLRDGKTMTTDWQELMKQTLHHVDVSPLLPQLYIFSLQYSQLPIITWINFMPPVDQLVISKLFTQVVMPQRRRLKTLVV